MTFWDGQRWSDDRAQESRRQSRTKRAVVHWGQALLEGGLVAVLVGGLVVGTAFAGRGGGGTTATPWIALGSVDGAKAAARPSLGSSVTFDAGYARNTKNPWVSLRCYQDGTLVYGEGGKVTDTFTLGGGSSKWRDVGGAASCRAELGDLYWKGGYEYYTYLAETSFDAAAP
jgi:hypothetical protein